jgi:GNAT superfamily N-acetyltransferase
MRFMRLFTDSAAHHTIWTMHVIRRCRPNERAEILGIINAAAEIYRGVIPADRWHDPYMSQADLDREIEAGVDFWGYQREGDLLGIMGMQKVREVDLIRHAYVKPGNQRLGIGGALIAHLRTVSRRRMLVGTWADAAWAIAFYQHNDFELVPEEHTAEVLKKYWDIPQRQIDTSVVLAYPPLQM